MAKSKVAVDYFSVNQTTDLVHVPEYMIFGGIISGKVVMWRKKKFLPDPGCDIPFFECLLFLSDFSKKQAISMSVSGSKSATFFEILEVFCLFFLSRLSRNQNYVYLF